MGRPLHLLGNRQLGCSLRWGPWSWRGGEIEDVLTTGPENPRWICTGKGRKGRN
jgi:hypothetical protein